MGSGVRQTWVQISLVALVERTMLDKLLGLSELQASY